MKRPTQRKKDQHVPETHDLNLCTVLLWIRQQHDITVTDSLKQKEPPEYSCFYRALLQKRRIILRSLVLVATAYQ